MGHVTAKITKEMYYRTLQILLICPVKPVSTIHFMYHVSCIMYPPKYNITRSSGMKNAILLWPIMMITMYYLIIHLDIFLFH